MKKQLKQQKPTLENNSSLRNLSILHFIYLFFFSGMEFTLTFLTFNLFNFSNINQGKLLGFIGISTSLLQGLVIRRITHKKIHERNLVLIGSLSCSIGLLLISSTAIIKSILLLYIGAFFLSITSATVVSSLTAIASFEAKESAGKLGSFRSYGQLGRSIGPIFTCSFYWVFGGVKCYLLGSILMLAVVFLMYFMLPGIGDWKPESKKND